MIMSLPKPYRNIINVIFKVIMQHIVDDGSHFSLLGCSSKVETKQHDCVMEIANGSPQKYVPHSSGMAPRKHSHGLSCLSIFL